MKTKDKYKALRDLTDIEEINMAHDFHWDKRMFWCELISGNQHLPGVIKTAKKEIKFHEKCMQILKEKIWADTYKKHVFENQDG